MHPKIYTPELIFVTNCPIVILLCSRVMHLKFMGRTDIILITVDQYFI